MVEKHFQSIFTKWVRENPPTGSAVWELKMVKGPSIAFDRVSPHQVEALKEAKRSGIFHKISDSPVSWQSKLRFTKPKPFDCLYIFKPEAYVVLLFYKPRKAKEVLFIDIDDWVDEMLKVERKSLTEKRAKEISKKIETI